MNAYMEKVDAVATKVVAWRKVKENKKTFRGSLVLQVALVIYNIELGGEALPGSGNFRGLVIGKVMELELAEDSADPELPM